MGSGPGASASKSRADVAVVDGAEDAVLGPGVGKGTDLAPDEVRESGDEMAL